MTYCRAHSTAALLYEHCGVRMEVTRVLTEIRLVNHCIFMQIGSMNDFPWNLELVGNAINSILQQSAICISWKYGSLLPETK